MLKPGEFYQKSYPAVASGSTPKAGLMELLSTSPRSVPVRWSRQTTGIRSASASMLEGAGKPDIALALGGEAVNRFTAVISAMFQ